MSIEIKLKEKGLESTIPFPLCDKCNKDVSVFKAKIEVATIKFEAECHGAYEMYRVLKDDLLGVKGIQKGLAFKQYNNRPCEIVLKESEE